MNKMQQIIAFALQITFQMKFSVFEMQSLKNLEVPQKNFSLETQI